MAKYCIIYTTYSDDKVGEKIIKSLLDKKLAACIQVSQVQSFYFWEGKVENENEKLLTIKTKSSLYQEIEKDILKNHNYDTPEIVKVDIEDGYLEYLNWMDETTKNS